MNIPANIPEWKKQKYRMVQSWQTLNKSCQPGQTVFTGSSLMEMFPVEKFAAEEGPDFPIVYNRAWAAGALRRCSPASMRWSAASIPGGCSSTSAPTASPTQPSPSTH